MVSSTLAFSFLWRMAILFATMLLAAWAWLQPGYYALTLLAAIAIAAISWDTLRFLSRTNELMTRLLDALQHRDFSLHIGDTERRHWPELTQRINTLIDDGRQQRQAYQDAHQQLQSLIEHSPAPLISIDEQDNVVLHNHAARQLLDTRVIARRQDLAKLSANLPEQIEILQPGQRALVTVLKDNSEKQLRVQVSQFRGQQGTIKLVSLQDIQQELDEVQMQSWHELVRVLTHEIMNSLTPVRSLAATAADITNELVVRLPAENTENTDPLQRQELAQVHKAVATVARRAEGLASFIERYRSFTLTPTPVLQTLNTTDYLSRVCDLFSSDSSCQTIQFETVFHEVPTTFRADPNLLEQALINILQNAARAARQSAEPRVQLKAAVSENNELLIEIEDNGTGIDPANLQKIFVPFFTTEKGGSGIGLALTRQIVFAHGGTVSVTDTALGGACFRLNLPASTSGFTNQPD